MNMPLTSLNFPVYFTMMSENLQKIRFLKQGLPNSSTSKLILITGARQTGKTTLAKNHFPHLRYINLDAPENREFIRKIPTASWDRDIGNAVIDEAQKEPEVFEKIKYAFDEKSITFTVLLGSSQILLLKKIRESLAGRVSIYELWPLMMSEIIRPEESGDYRMPLVDRLFSGSVLDDILNRVPAVLLDRDYAQRIQAEQYLFQWGGMPALLPLDDQERWKWLKDYGYTYLERDLTDLARLDDLAPFRKFQKLSALRSGQLLNYSELARDAGISVDTSRRYLEYLNISYQVILLQPYYRNITSSLVKTPKIYWLDLGLLRMLCGFRETEYGPIYETMVVAEFLKWIKTMQRQGELYFYRTRSGLEIDLLLQIPQGIIGIEIKGRKKVSASDCRAMKEIAARLGSEWLGGMVVYRGLEIKQLGTPNLWAVPSFRLFTW
jgi:predicted AAA+ superfamily ATPase